jgi:CMP-N,N'-diacetyllegionaminic acid synthase
MTDHLSILALIPARSGSKRIPNKNIRVLAGHPLIAYAISAARDSGIFSDVLVSTDSEEIARISRHYGATVPQLRPKEFAEDASPDIDWVRHMLDSKPVGAGACDCFSILRPTSPFRTSGTIQRAWKLFLSEPGIDSLRAVEKCAQHPGKMWVPDGGPRRIRPLLDQPDDRPWHSMPYQALPEIYAQNASLEIAWCRVVRQTGTIAGSVICPFFTEDLEGFDLNRPDDWVLAEHYLHVRREAILPPVRRPRYSDNPSANPPKPPHG